MLSRVSPRSKQNLTRAERKNISIIFSQYLQAASVFQPIRQERNHGCQSNCEDSCKQQRVLTPSLARGFFHSCALSVANVLHGRSATITLSFYFSRSLPPFPALSCAPSFPACRRCPLLNLSEYQTENSTLCRRMIQIKSFFFPS